jgi:hypothetical protein
MPITLYGTEAQKQKYVPKLATGEWFGAYCLTEPGAGSDANSGKTKAVLSEDGTHYKITGQKMWISNAGFCSLFIVFARLEDDKNITGFIIENDPSNGITMNEEEHKLGIRASSTRQVFFNETKVLISVTGSGLSNCMFMQPGTLVIELLTPLILGEMETDSYSQIIENHYSGLAAIFGINYMAIPHDRSAETILEKIDNLNLGFFIENYNLKNFL